MAKESNYVVRFNVFKIQVVNATLSLSSQETKEQHQTVTITMNGMGAHAANGIWSVKYSRSRKASLFDAVIFMLCSPAWTAGRPVRHTNHGSDCWQFDKV
jgi:hypothetical protein